MKGNIMLNAFRKIAKKSNPAPEQVLMAIILPNGSPAEITCAKGEEERFLALNNAKFMCYL